MMYNYSDKDCLTDFKNIVRAEKKFHTIDDFDQGTKTLHAHIS